MFNTEVRGALAVDVLGTLAHGPVVPPGPPAAHLHSDDQDRVYLIYWPALSMYPIYPRMLSGWNAKRKGASARSLRSHPINQYKHQPCTSSFTRKHVSLTKYMLIILFIC